MSDRRVVIDASAALKWRLRDEEATAEADAILSDMADGSLDLLAPTLFDYEIVNALRVAVFRGRLAEEDARTAVADFQALPIQRCDFAPLHSVAFDLATRYQRSGYDAAYLALAQSYGSWFFTGDKRLLNGVAHALPWVKWIGDYRLAAVPIIES